MFQLASIMISMHQHVCGSCGADKMCFSVLSQK